MRDNENNNHKIQIAEKLFKLLSWVWVEEKQLWREPHFSILEKFYLNKHYKEWWLSDYTLSFQYTTDYHKKCSIKNNLQFTWQVEDWLLVWGDTTH